MISELPTIGFPADVYSYGIILWQIFTRVPPYQKVSPVAIIRDVPQNKLRPEIPAELQQTYGLLMRQCWAQEPKDRPMFDAIADGVEKLLKALQTKKE